MIFVFPFFVNIYKMIIYDSVLTSNVYDVGLVLLFYIFFVKSFVVGSIWYPFLR